MKLPKTIITTAILTAATLFQSEAQRAVSPDSALGRGYIDCPYSRYEAEQGKCSTNAIFIGSEPYSQRDLASEASNIEALTLVNQGDYVEWTLDAEADALTLRFSVPDAADGSGLKATVALYAGDTKLRDLVLDSYWAWQYTIIRNNSEKYPDNTPSADKFARMRFDEINILLPKTLAKGKTFRIALDEAPAAEVTIDFCELEKAPAALTFDDITDADKVEFTGTGSTLATFIANNQGKAIFIPAGTYDIPRRITVTGNNTRVYGAGMWHTTLNFTASSDQQSTYSQRGIDVEADNCHLSGVSLTTVNNKRYFRNNSSFQVGKGLMGSWGSNSSITDVRVDHFECGGWIADYSGRSTNGLTISHCRFRNNYADGINLSSGCRDVSVSHCSFRNNGDDDMASWSSTNRAENVEFSYCTAENNWRASSLGFFGGKNIKAHHISIIDAMEGGARVNGDFAGTGFGSSGELLLEEISIRRCGTRGGPVGTIGDFWGNNQPSLQIKAGPNYALRNLTIRHVDIFDSRHHGVGISSANSKTIENLILDDVSVNGVDNYEYAFHIDSSTRGNGTYRDLSATDVVEPWMTSIPSTFDFRQLPSSSIETVAANPTFSIKAGRDSVVITTDSSRRIELYSIDGRQVGDYVVDGFREVGGIGQGVFIARDIENFYCRKFCL